MSLTPRPSPFPPSIAGRSHTAGAYPSLEPHRGCNPAMRVPDAIADLPRHARESVRHFLALLLMAGTLAGTVYTFSNGRLTLADAWERITSVGGVAAALELGAIYCGWYIGQLDLRMLAARRGEARDELKAYRDELIKWFYVVVGISVGANFLFRVHQLDNAALAAFVAACPAPLIVLFTIKLRPLPTDYAEIGRQATQRGLITLVSESQHVMLKHIRAMGRGRQLTDADMAQLGFAAALVRTYAAPAEQQALDYAISQGTPAGAGIVEGSAVEWLRTSDISRLYGVPMRTAQEWMAHTPGRRRTPRGNAWEAPASAIYGARGLPQSGAMALPAPASRPRRTASRPRLSAEDAPLDAPVAQAHNSPDATDNNAGYTPTRPAGIDRSLDSGIPLTVTP